MNKTKSEYEEDLRWQIMFRLIENVPLKDIDSILDIGAGKGQLAKYLSQKGKKVTCTGLAIDSYIDDVNALRDQYGIEYIECNVESMPFADASFDAVIMSHVLEHCPDVGRALGHARRVLRGGGLLLVFVPPQEDLVLAGHVSVGWNIGQLMYVLLLNGFDVRSGSFIKYGYNIFGFVRRSERKLPQLRFDFGDISVLAREGFFPLPIGIDGFGESFNGDIRAINWPNVSQYETPVQINVLRRTTHQIIFLIPIAIRLPIGKFLAKLGSFLMRSPIENSKHLT
jgi:SAM-dependent methyltransferase